MAGAPGFEPGDAGIKTRCLTAWRRPKMSSALCLLATALSRAAVKQPKIWITSQLYCSMNLFFGFGCRFNHQHGNMVWVFLNRASHYVNDHSQREYNIAYSPSIKARAGSYHVLHISRCGTLGL